MKLTISLMAFLLCLGSVRTVCGQANPHSFFVKHVVFEADHTPSFVWAIANSIIPWEGNSSSDDVACLKTELRKTGIFKRIESRLHRLNESDGYDLILTIEYELTEPAYKLSAINVLGVEGVDDSAFKKLLASEGFMERPLSLKTADYAIFVERLLDLIEKSIPAAPQRERTKSLWVEIRLDRKKELRVTVMPDFKGCDSFDKREGAVRGRSATKKQR